MGNSSAKPKSNTSQDQKVTEEKSTASSPSIKERETDTTAQSHHDITTCQKRQVSNGIFPSGFVAEFGLTVKSPERFYEFQDTKSNFGFFSETTTGKKYPKIIHINQPYKGWTKEILIDDEGNTSVQFIPPLNTGDESCRSQLHTIRNREELKDVISRKTASTTICATLLEESFEFDDLFCLCHRSDEGDYFNCDYGLAGCNSWFHSDCIGISKSALLRLVPGKDTPLVCPLCTAYLESNLDEDRVYSTDSSTSEDRTIYRLRMGGYYYITIGPLLNYISSTPPLPLIVDIVSKSYGRDVPYFRNIGGLEIIQSRNPPRYWGMSRLRAPVTTIRDYDSDNIKSPETAEPRRVESKTLAEEWIANCSRCGHAGPFKVIACKNDREQLEKVGLGMIYELHVVPRPGATGISDFCGQFRVNPRKKPKQYFDSSYVNNQAHLSTSSSPCGRIVKKVSKKALPIAPVFTSNSIMPQCKQNSRCVALPGDVQKHTRDPAVISAAFTSTPQTAVRYDKSYDSCAQLRPSYKQKSILQHRFLQIQEQKEKRDLMVKYLFFVAPKKNGNAPNANVFEPNVISGYSADINTTLKQPESQPKLEMSFSPSSISQSSTLPFHCYDLSSGVSDVCTNEIETKPRDTFIESISPINLSPFNSEPGHPPPENLTDISVGQSGLSGAFSQHVVSDKSFHRKMQSDTSRNLHESILTIDDELSKSLSSKPNKEIELCNDSSILHASNSSPSVTSNNYTANDVDRSSLFKDQSVPNSVSKLDNTYVHSQLPSDGKNHVESVDGVGNVQVYAQLSRDMTVAEDLPVTELENNVKYEQRALKSQHIADCEKTEVKTILHVEQICDKEENGLGSDGDEKRDNCLPDVEHKRDELSQDKIIEIEENASDSKESAIIEAEAVVDILSSSHNKFTCDQKSFVKDVQKSIKLSHDSNSFESDDSRSEATPNKYVNPVVNYHDENFLKRKRKAMSTTKPYEYFLKKRLLESESSRISSCFQNVEKSKGNDNKDGVDYLFLNLPLEDGGVRTCGFNVNPRTTSSVDSYIDDDDSCSYCFEPFLSSEETALIDLGSQISKLHASCSDFLLNNSLRAFIQAENYSHLLNVGEIFSYTDAEDRKSCNICDKTGGVMHNYEILVESDYPPHSNSGAGETSDMDSSGSNTSNLMSMVGNRRHVAHPLCIVYLAKSKRLEVEKELIKTDDRRTDVSARNNVNGYCTICGSNKGVLVTCFCSCCLVQVHYLCAKRQQWNVDLQVVVVDSNSDSDRPKPTNVFICPLHSA